MLGRRIIGGCIVVGLGLVILLFLRDRLFFDPPLFCLTPPPSETTVVHAIRFGPGDGSSGVGQDGRRYSIKPLECPHWTGVGSPKLKMWLRIHEGKKVVAEKAIGVAIVDEGHVVIMGLP